MIGLFSGIIIDTFSDLKSKEDDTIKNTNEICFICSKNKESFKTYNINLEKH